MVENKNRISRACAFFTREESIKPNHPGRKTAEARLPQPARPGLPQLPADTEEAELNLERKPAAM